MSAITLNPRYIPLVQKPKCCAAACLQMVLYRGGFGLYDQEDLAIQLGAKICLDDVNAFRVDMPIMTRFNFDEGISTVNSCDTINALLKSKNIGLTLEAHMHSEIRGLSNLIAEHIKYNEDVWVEYHSHEIHAGKESVARIHDALVESVDLQSRTAVLVDPKPTRKQRLTVDLAMLDRAMSSKFGKELGLLIVKKVS